MVRMVRCLRSLSRRSRSPSRSRIRAKVRTGSVSPSVRGARPAAPCGPLRASCACSRSCMPSRSKPASSRSISARSIPLRVRAARILYSPQPLSRSFFADKSRRVAPVVDEAVADQPLHDPRSLLLSDAPAAQQPPGVAFALLGAGTEPHQRGERLLGALRPPLPGLLLLRGHSGRAAHVIRALPLRSSCTSMPVYPSAPSIRTISSAACS